MFQAIGRGLSIAAAAALLGSCLAVGTGSAAARYDSYAENFDDGNAQDWTAASGLWKEHNNRYGSLSVIKQGVSVYDGSAWQTDFTYSLKMQSVLGGSTPKLGAVYNYADEDDYAALELDGSGQARLIRVTDGDESTVASASYAGGGPLAWLDVEIVRERDTTTVKVNGSTVFDAIAQTGLAAGKIGLLIRHDLAQFDDIAVRTDYKETFPRLGGMLIGANKNYDDPAYQADISKLDLAVLGFYKGWRHGDPSVIRTAVQGIKALNPSILLGNYTTVNEIYTDPNNTSQIDVLNKVQSETGPNGIGDWFARNAAGEQVSSYPGTAYVNLTRFATPDANGDRFPQWFAKRNAAEFFTPIPEFDIWYSDNAMYKPRANPDWDGDGVDDSKDDPVVDQYFREGMASYWAAAKEQDPGVLVMGNSDGNGSLGVGYLRDPEYDGKLEGAVYEGAIGKSYSEETWSTWENMMSSYRSLMQHTLSPHLVMFITSGAADDYQIMRYGLASSLLDDGYFTYALDGSYSGVAWFDEFDIDLGKAVDEPQTAPWQNGVYMRRFENGMAIVNPKGNGTQTVTIPAGYKHFLGTQDPAVNDGQPVSTITLNEREGVILVKQ